MARIDNLNNFLTDVATSIKNKAGLTSITPADFDTTIDNLSIGLTPNGNIEEYYVYQGQTVNEGDFVYGTTGIGSVSTGESVWSKTGNFGSEREGVKGLFLTEDLLVYAWCDVDDNLCVGMAKVLQDNFVSFYKQIIMTNVPRRSSNGFAKLSNTEFILCWDGYGVYGRVEGEGIFFGKMTHIETNITSSAQTAMHSSADNSYRAWLGHVKSTSATKLYHNDNINADSTNNYTITHGTSAVIADNASSGTAISASGNFLRNLQGYVMTDKTLCCAYISGSAVVDKDTSATMGTTAIYGIIMDKNGSKYFGSLTPLVSTDYSTFKLLYPLSDNDWCYAVTAASDESITLHKIVTSGEIISTTSTSNFIAIQPNEVSCFVTAPMDSSTAILAWPLYRYYYNNSAYHTPIAFTVVTMSSSSASAGTVYILPSIPERLCRYPNDMTIVKRNNTSFALLTRGYSSDEIYIKMMSRSGSVITSNMTIGSLETQVAKAAANGTCKGIAKTSGTGGTATAHKDKVQIYVPN